MSGDRCTTIYAIRRRQWGARDFKTLFNFVHRSDAGDAGHARDATTQRTGTDPIFASKISRLSDTQIDQTQKIPEMSGMLRMQPAGHKKVKTKTWFFDIP